MCEKDGATVCKECKYFDSPHSFRICLACTGNPDEAYDKVFNPNSDRRPWND